MLQPQSGCGPVWIVDERRAPRHHRLPPVDLGHRQPAPGESFADAIDDRLVHVERKLQHTRHRVPRNVVLGGAQTAGHHDQLGPGERAFQHIGQLIDVIADDRFEPHIESDRVQPLCDDERVGVGAKGRQHLASDGDDAGTHVGLATR